MEEIEFIDYSGLLDLECEHEMVHEYIIDDNCYSRPYCIKCAKVR